MIKREEAKCTFKPKISKGSSKMTRPHTASTSNYNSKKAKRRLKSPNNVFDKLFQDSIKEPSKQKTRKDICDEKFYSECTFKPNLE